MCKLKKKIKQVHLHGMRLLSSSKKEKIVLLNCIEETQKLHVWAAIFQCKRVCVILVDSLPSIPLKKIRNERNVNEIDSIIKK